MTPIDAAIARFEKLIDEAQGKPLAGEEWYFRQGAGRALTFLREVKARELTLLGIESFRRELKAGEGRNIARAILL